MKKNILEMTKAERQAYIRNKATRKVINKLKNKLNLRRQLVYD